MKGFIFVRGNIVALKGPVPIKYIPKTFHKRDLVHVCT